jgi:hypothetical protein
MTGALHEDKNTFMIISYSNLLRKINVSDNFVEKSNTHILCPVTFFVAKIVIFMK